MIEKKDLFKIIVATVILFCSLRLSFAETVYLKSGKKVEGKVIERTDKYIKIDFKGVSLTYGFDEIESIDGVPLSSTDGRKKKGALVIVGDATLTYASYFFLLPPNWIPLMDNMELTDKTGYWHGKHKNSQTLMEIQPVRKAKETTLGSIINLTKEYSEKGLPSTSWQKCLYFKPVINYTSETYTFNNSTNGTYELFTFIEIPPGYVITFILTGKGKDEKCITPYLDDFNNVISSFKWILGFSDEEIGKMLKQIQ